MFFTSLLTYLSAVTLTLQIQATNVRDSQTYLNTCTAVMVSPNTALTAAHCLRRNQSGRMWVKTSDGKSFSAELVHKQSLKDLALIKIHCPPRTVYARLGRPVKRRDRVYTLNSGRGIAGTYGEGIVKNVILEDEYAFETHMIMHSAEISKGASGSGLFNKHRELVGINTLTFGASSEAVDISEIRRFLAPIDD